MLGLLWGGLGVPFRRGSRRHQVAGNVFVISMLSLSASAVCLAFMKHQTGNVIGGIFTFYLVATAWSTARSRNGETGAFGWVALLVPLAVGIANVIYGLEKAFRQTGFKNDGVPAGMNFFLGA